MRLTLLVPAGLWRKIPPEIQSRFTLEAGRDESGSDEPIDGLVEHLESLDPEKLVETQSLEIAGWLGLTPPHFTRLFLNNRWRLFELAAYRDFIRFPQPGPAFFATLFSAAREQAADFLEADWSRMGRRPTEDADQTGAPAGWAYRCLLLAMTGLWSRLPRGFWPAWFAADGFPAPFPPDKADFATGTQDSDSARREVSNAWDIDQTAARLEPAFSDHPHQPMKRRRIATTFRQEQPRLLELECISSLVQWEDHAP